MNMQMEIVKTQCDRANGVERLLAEGPVSPRHVLASNPFTDNRVNAPSARDIDVETVHQQAFERLTALAREAHDERRGLGAMLWGEAGIGKSHLLARLALG